MKKITFTCFLLVFSLALFAQEFEVPKNYILEKAEDYAPYEQDVIDCVNWLMATPLNKQESKRKEANAFLLKWLMGSPNVNIDIKQEIVTFMSTSPNLLMIFMGGWAKYSLETTDFDNKYEGSMAGIESVIEFYTKNREVMSKDKHVEKYIKMKDKGTLEEYVKDNV